MEVMQSRFCCDRVEVRFQAIDKEEGRMKYLGLVLICIMLVPAAALAAGYNPTTIYDIQQGAWQVGDSVLVDSVVVTNIDLKATTYGFHAQERGGGPWSGILVYCSGTPPAVEIGDLVRVWGDYDEYYDHSEIQTEGHHDGGYEILVPNYGALPCTLLSCHDLGVVPLTDSTWCEKWEGVFVCIDTVIVTELHAYQEFSSEEAHVHPGEEDTSYTVRTDDKCCEPTLPQPHVGDTLVTVRGTFAEEYDNYKIWPRSPADVVYLHGAPAPSLVAAYAVSDSALHAVFDTPVDQASAEYEDNYSLESGVPIKQAVLDTSDSLTVLLNTGTTPQGVRDSLTVCDISAAHGATMTTCQKMGFRSGITEIRDVQIPTDDTDASPMNGERVTLTGIIVHADSTFNGPFFMQHPDGGPWNGIYVYAFPSQSYDVGTKFTVSGYVQEYYNWTEISGVDYISVWGGGPYAFTGPTVVTPDLIKTGADTAESYESVYVKMDSVMVLTPADTLGEWYCGSMTDSVAVGDFTCVYNPCYTYPLPCSWIRIEGCLRFHYAEFKIEPRADSDITELEACVAGIRGDEVHPLMLAQNAPNPFVGETRIKFSVPRQMKVKLSVYDISGRLVKTVADGKMEAGEHSFAWDGRDSFSRSVSPGIYFLRMSTPERSLQKKMVLLH